ncbi:TerD family protein, partial [Priestia megaterium]
RDNYAGRTSLITAEIYRSGSEWKFAAIGEGTNDTRLEDIISRYV